MCVKVKLKLFGATIVLCFGLPLLFSFLQSRTAQTLAGCRSRPRCRGRRNGPPSSSVVANDGAFVATVAVAAAIIIVLLCVSNVQVQVAACHAVYRSLSDIRTSGSGE